jgi:hypothetical protein
MALTPTRYNGPDPNGSPTRQTTVAEWGLDTPSAGLDWRVKVHLPSVLSFVDNPLLRPLEESGNAMVFPITPQVMIAHSASYNALSLTHSNYPFPIYSHSQVDDITIAGKFPVENEKDGRYWLAAIHFLRSVTKMFYGNAQNNLGAPPPLVYLSGYGDYVFNKVPGVVKLFTVDMPNDVDYIKVPLSDSQASGFEAGTVRGGFAYVPVLSTVTLTYMPAYSRDQVRRFSLDSFVRGGFIGQGPDQGFI